jgi:hypothetical protein
MRRLLVTTLKLLPVVAGASFVSIIGLWLVRQWVSLPELQRSNSEVGNYIQALGTVYAVLLAFVASTVWAQFNEARSLVDQEANEVVDLFRTTDGLPAAEREVVQATLRRYVERVLSEEWRAMACGDERVLESVGGELDAIWQALHCFEPTNVCHTTLHAEALTRFNDLSDARTLRLTSARTRIPYGLKLFLVIGGLMMIGSMYLIAVDRFRMHAIMTGALAGAISHVLFVVFDLDDPFAGDWQVSRTTFERVQRYMKERVSAP